MKPSQHAKSIGLKSLKQVSEMQGFKPNGKPIVRTETLINWHRDKPLLFKHVLAGCLVMLNRTPENDAGV